MTRAALLLPGSALLALTATGLWLWMTRGASVVLDLGATSFCL